MKASKAKATPASKSLRQSSNDISYKLVGLTIKALDGLKEISIGAYEGTGRAIKDYQSTNSKM